MENFQIINGDCLDMLRGMESESVHCCVTSPPYFGLRDYGVEKQIGLEATPAEFVAKMVEVFGEVRRVLRSDGTLWLNLGDSFWGSGKGLNPDGTHSSENSPTDKQFTNKGSLKTKVTKYPEDCGLKQKDLIGIPWRVAFALQESGWWLRQDIIWAKPNPMPESVTDRCTKSHEYIFLLTKSAKYFYDGEAIKESSVTDDLRRPYGSQGAWDMDGRPAEQRHGGEIRDSWKGSQFHTGKTAVHQLGRSSTNRKSRVTPEQTSAFFGNPPTNLERCGDNVTANRNKRSVWTVTTQPFAEAHFATFPPKLIEPCILAGTSEKGCCADCGSPWRRVVGKIVHANGGGRNHIAGGDKTIGVGWEGVPRATIESETTGWEKTCKCETDEVMPCTVLDPFNGAGTSGLVALKNRRKYVGIELNPEYVDLTQRRLAEVQVKLF